MAQFTLYIKHHGKSFMKTTHLLLMLATASISLSQLAHSDSFSAALTEGKTTGDIRIRYEGVDQDNSLKDAHALTMRIRIAYVTNEFKGFSITTEFEDVRVIAGIDKYSVGPTGLNPGEYSVIADPEVTELDQGFLQYTSKNFTAKLGRQVMTFDNHRFIGHVGWRQDRQTFDGLALSITPIDDLSIHYNYIEERQRIFAEKADADSNDHLLNVAYKTPVGTIVAYGYFLELDNDTGLNTDNTIDTIGLRFTGKKATFSYAVEYATQTFENWTEEYDANYLMGELAYNFGPVTLKGTYEILGSDDGDYGFSTPLATVHKFNGWADQFLGTPAAGIEDLAISLNGKAGPGKWAVIYHSFSSDTSMTVNPTDGGSSYSVDDLGSELDAVFSMGFAKHYNFGVKAALYSAGDEEFGKVDTNKTWLWVGVKF